MRNQETFEQNRNFTINCTKKLTKSKRAANFSAFKGILTNSFDLFFLLLNY